jgi:hypothetical protein
MVQELHHLDRDVETTYNYWREHMYPKRFRGRKLGPLLDFEVMIYTHELYSF